ncbi:MAG: serine protease [Akkermansiaceae bacterium]
MNYRFIVCLLGSWVCASGFLLAGAAPSVIDDQKILRQIPAKIGSLVEKEQTLGWKELLEQMKRPKVSLKLPKISGESLKNLYAKRADGVVAIASVYKCGKCTKWHSSGAATGWVLTEDGVMVTNYHVFDGKEKAGFAVMTRDGQFAPVVEILAASKRDDVAIFRVKGSGFSPIPIGSDAAVGSDLHIIAHPDSRFYTYTSGRVSRYYHKRTQGKLGPALMAVTAEFARGSSGGPVMDSAGNVVGMVSSTNSIYYPPRKKTDKQGPFQMVIRNCVPVKSIRNLIEVKK